MNSQERDIKTPGKARVQTILVAVLCVITAGQVYGQADIDKQAKAAEAVNWPAGKTAGWRGDWTGLFPGTNPPTEWSKSKNMRWAVKMPYYSFSSPVIVGNSMFVRSDPNDLICLDKKTGKVKWVRSINIAQCEEERKSAPALKAIEGLVNQLEKLNESLYSGVSLSERVLKEKKEKQNKINEETCRVDRKKYALQGDCWNSGWGGLTAQTPCTDGKNIYLYSGFGIAACFDLEGKLKWAKYFGPLPTNEHGHNSSPALSGDCFIFTPVNWMELIALKKETGAVAWRQKPVCHNYNGSVVPFKEGGTDYVFALANVVRSSDGKVYPVACGISVDELASTPVYQNGFVYAIGSTGNFYKIKTDAQGREPKPTGVSIDVSNQQDPNVKRGGKDHWNVTANCHVASPLFYKGLVFIVSTQACLSVVDAESMSLVYQKKLELNGSMLPGRPTHGEGVCASPTLGGRNVYIMDDKGTTLVIEAGRQYKEIAKNKIECQVTLGKGPLAWSDAVPRQELSLSSPVFEGNFIYYRAEENLYCIGSERK